MATFSLTEWINASAETIFPKLHEEETAKQIMPGIQVYKKIGDGPVGMGTRFHETRVVNGREASNEIYVSAFDPPNTYAATSEHSGIKATYTYKLSAENDGTRVTLVADVDAGGLRKLFIPLVVRMMKKEDSDHLTRLKAVIEKAAG